LSGVNIPGAIARRAVTTKEEIMRSILKAAILSLLAGCLARGTGIAFAQDYPVRPVRIVTGQPASMMDIVSRALAQHLGERWGRPVVVENRGGPGNSPTVVSQATPDGYTLLIADSTALAVRPHLYRTLPYAPERDFAPITLVATSPSFLIAHRSIPAGNLREFLEYARRQPNGVDFANAGPWTNSHLTAELFRRMAGINIVPVNYKGGGAASAAIVSGEAKFGFSNLFMAFPHLRAGRVKAYAVTSERRFAGAPDIPTMAEAGGGTLVTNYWFGLLAPKGTPPPLVKRLNHDVSMILQTPEMKSLLVDQGAETGQGSPEEFGGYIRGETARLKSVIDSAGIKTE
jgi:tripartite-type tricarboxylate transporter receptor subunit TctC